MDCNRSAEACLGCPATIVCRCLHVTEAAVVEAIAALDLQTIKDVRRHTGAGDGCTCCHARLRAYLEQVRCPTAACA